MRLSYQLLSFIFLLSIPFHDIVAAPVLKSVEELVSFLAEGNDSVRHHYSVTGTVTSTYISPSTNENHSFVLQGVSERIFVFNSVPTPPCAGTIVVASGVIYFSPSKEPWMYCDAINDIGVGGFVKEAPKIVLSQLDMTKFNLRELTVEATISSVLRDEVDPNYSFLILSDKGITLPAACKTTSQLKDLENAHIYIKGLLRQNVYGQRKHLGPCLYVKNLGDITVITPPPSDPFDFPPLPKRSYIRPQDIAKLGKRSVAGNVIATWKNCFYVTTTEKRLVEVKLLEDEPLPAYGTFVKVIGIPETDLYRIDLTDARVKPEMGPTLDETDIKPQSIDGLFRFKNGTISFNDEIRGNLATVCGIVCLLPSVESKDRRLTLDCGQCKIPVDFYSNPSAADNLAIGCRVEVTGRCLIEAEKWNPNRIFPRITGLTLVIRKPEDIRVLSRPSWWTPQRLLLVIAGLFSALVVIIIWNRLLQRLVERRGRELYRAEIDKTKTELKIGERTRLAVELHDSISQALAGIAYQLTSSKDAVRADADSALSRIETADRMLKSCRTELRHRLHDLRSDMLEEPDFEQAVRKTISQLEGDAKIILRVNVRRSLMNDTTAQDILSVVRELVSNALHHGQAKTVKIAGCADNDALRFSVRDDGTGFDPANAPGARQGHFGLVGIRYRLKRQNGDLSIDSSVNGGTRVSFEIPLVKDEDTSEDICK